MEKMKLKYEWDNDNGVGSEEFDYVPAPEEITDYLLQNSDVETVLDRLICRFYDELLESLKDKKEFVEFLTDRHTAAEFEEEEYWKHYDEIEPSREHILANL